MVQPHQLFFEMNSRRTGRQMSPDRFAGCSSANRLASIFPSTRSLPAAWANLGEKKSSTGSRTSAGTLLKEVEMHTG